MKYPRINDFVFTNDDCGIVTWVGIGSIMLNNNINNYKVNFEDIDDVIRGDSK